MSGLPRGWAVQMPASTLVAGGPLVLLTIPGIPGISHILTNIEAMLVGTTNSMNFAPAIQISTTTRAPLSLGFLVIIASQVGVTNPKDTMSWQGEFVSPIGDALTVAFSGALAGAIEILSVAGYDV